MTAPLIEIIDISREYMSGGEPLRVLKNVSLNIYSGEMVAIMGTSGSGKSTLMNILGCLDQPNSGIYRVAGFDIAKLGPDEVAKLRRKYFGFIFQRYNLLTDLTALHNVEMPAVYEGIGPDARRQRAESLLKRVGLATRMDHYPNQLSGGQQQRVSIARALMNGGSIILADEPTGALDTTSGEEVMNMLKELHAEGHTVILVTHDPKVATHAGRIIRIQDGEIISDRRTEALASRVRKEIDLGKEASGWSLWRRGMAQAARTAIKSMSAHKLRTFLTMLGIIIGIASVVSMVALGRGTQARIMRNISALGVNTITIYPSGASALLTRQDYAELRAQPYVESGSPMLDVSEQMRFGNVAEQGRVQGVSEEFMQLHDHTLTEGRMFTAMSVARNAQELVLDEKAREKLFGRKKALGSVVFMGSVPLRVVGVVRKKGSVNDSGNLLEGWIPYSTAQTRFKRQTNFESLELRIRSHVSMEAAQNLIGQLLISMHGGQDFSIQNTQDFARALQQTRAATNLLISSIAFISLVVGGIGVMNIMLVAVIERTREIGIRVAVGARQSDIMQQFLIESVLVCLVGGAIGVVTAFMVRGLASYAGEKYEMIFSFDSVATAFLFSMGVGVIFGFFPARNAARLNPVEALSRE